MATWDLFNPAYSIYMINYCSRQMDLLVKVYFHRGFCLLQKLTADLQGQLNIDVQKKMRWWNELLAAKRDGTLAPK